MRFVVGVVALLAGYASKQWAVALVGGVVAGTLFGGWLAFSKLGGYEMRDRRRRAGWPFG